MLDKFGEHFGGAQTHVTAESIRYKALLGEFKTDWKKEIGTWTRSTMGARMHIMQFEKKQLKECSESLKSLMVNVKTKIDEERKTRTQESATKARARNK